MQTCSFCGRKTRRALKIASLCLCESCEASLIHISARSAAYDWFLQAVRRALSAREKINGCATERIYE